MLSFSTTSNYPLQRRSAYLEARQNNDPSSSTTSSPPPPPPSPSPSRDANKDASDLSFTSEAVSTTSSSPSSSSSLSSSSFSFSSSSSFAPTSSSLSTSSASSSSPPSFSSASSPSPTPFSPSPSPSLSSSIAVTVQTVTSTAIQPVSSSSTGSIDTAGRILVTDTTSFFNPTPAITFAFTEEQSSTSIIFSIVSTSTSSTVNVTSAVAAAASNNGFWSNKSAVAGTVTAVVVAVLGAIAALYICIRRRRASTHYNDEAFPEKIPGLSFSDSRPTSEPSSQGHELIMEAPLDAHANREPVYFPRDPFANYPYAAGTLPEITYSYARDVNKQYPYYPGDSDEGRTSRTPSPPSGTGPKLLAQTQTIQPPSTATNLNPFADPVLAEGAYHVAASDSTRPPGISEEAYCAAVSHTSSDSIQLPRKSEGEYYVAASHYTASHSTHPPSNRDSSYYQPSIDSFYGVPPEGEAHHHGFVNTPGNVL